MSYTTLFLVPESGPIQAFSEFRNAFRGGYLVWDNMAKRYLGQDASMYMIKNNMQPVWDIHANLSVPEAHRIVMMSTFDKVMVRKDNLERLAIAFEQYSQDFDDPGHIPSEATALRELMDNEGCYAVCWQQTSVSADDWVVMLDDGSDERRPYDVSLDNEHWFLFDNLED